jgi:hypothetical protein
LLADDDKRQSPQGMPQMPGFSFLVIDALADGPGATEWPCRDHDHRSDIGADQAALRGPSFRISRKSLACGWDSRHQRKSSGIISESAGSIA